MNASLEKIFWQKSTIFQASGLNTPWEEVLDLGTRKYLPRGHEVINDMDDIFFYLIKGSLSLSGVSEDGHEKIVMLSGKGNIFGEINLVHKSVHHYYSLRTLESCEFSVFPKAMLSDTTFCRDYPHLILNLTRSIAIKAGAFLCQIYDTTLMNSRAQICRILLQLWQENGKLRFLNPEISQTDLANILGIHRNSVCRTILDLRKKHIIGQFSKKKLEIKDPSQLIKFSKINQITGID